MTVRIGGRRTSEVNATAQQEPGKGKGRTEVMVYV
jgi:hypothetical protein